MIYLATSFILLGLFLFIIASFDLFDFENKSSQSSRKSNPRLNKILARPVPKKNSKEKDLKISMERKVDKTDYRKNAEIFFTSPKLDDFPVEEEYFTKPKTNSIIQVSTKIMQPVEFKALVYLDYSNRIKDLKLKENPVFPFNLLKELKRIGNIIIKKEDGNYLFQTELGILEYKKEDIERIHFLEEAIFLFPEKKILPTPILFSDNLSELKPILTK